MSITITIQAYAKDLYENTSIQTVLIQLLHMCLFILDNGLGVVKTTLRSIQLLFTSRPLWWSQYIQMTSLKYNTSSRGEKIFYFPCSNLSLCLKFQLNPMSNGWNTLPKGWLFGPLTRPNRPPAKTFFGGTWLFDKDIPKNISAHSILSILR